MMVVHDYGGRRLNRVQRFGSCVLEAFLWPLWYAVGQVVVGDFFVDSAGGESHLLLEGHFHVLLAADELLLCNLG